MRIYITGASGFLGKALVPLLLDQQHDVTMLLLPGEPPPSWDGVNIVRGDITDPASLSGTLRGHDALIHLAGIVGYGQRWDTCIRVNVLGTKNLVRAAISSGVRRFIHLSSVSVYGRVAEQDINEEFPFKKINDPYGDTKIDAEDILWDHSHQGDIDLTILRPTVIYGPGDDKFLPRLMDNLRGRRSPMIGSGKNRVDLIHVSDISQLITTVLATPASIGQAYNVTNPDNPNWQNFMGIVSTAMKQPAPTRKLPYSLALIVAGAMELWAKITGQDPKFTRYAVTVIGRHYHYNTDKMTKVLGFSPSIKLEEGITQCVKYIEGARP